MARMAAQIPPPRMHQTRYHGILAPAAGWRGEVVPDTRAELPATCAVGKSHQILAARSIEQRRPWAELMRRVFSVDVLECEQCGGRARVAAVALDEPLAEALLAEHQAVGRAPPA